MKFLVRKASDFDNNGEFKDFFTIDELMKFRELVKHDVIITACYDALTDEYVPAILIYDDYIE